MTDPEWLGVLISITAGAVSVGVSLGKLGTVTRDVRSNRRSIENLGDRLEKLGDRCTVIETTLRVRRQTGAVQVPVQDEGSD
jgi:hypothetical protein